MRFGFFIHAGLRMQNTGSSHAHSLSTTGQDSNVFIAVRVRPLLDKECEKANFSTIDVLDRMSLVIRDNSDSDSPHRRRRYRDLVPKEFSFDCVLSEGADQETVFESTALPVIDAVCDGINACVFASGATGSGKTYTMLGEEDSPGVMMRALEALFARLGEFSNINIKCSFVEIYNEVVRDLLVDMVEGQPVLASLEIRDDPVTGMTVVHGTTEIEGLRDIYSMMELLHVGNSRRTTEPTAANETSSRSHAILQVVIEQHSDNGETIVSKLSLIDLAGSERARDTQNRGIRFIEGGNINKSLLALGNVIKALVAADDSLGTFIPYRDSKLTRLLRDSLGGNCKTVMIANVSPFIYNYADSLNTLKFAARAKNIKVRTKRNAFFANPKDEIRKYRSVIRELEGVVADLQMKLEARSQPQSPEEYAMYTDGSSSESSEEYLGSDTEEWVIKNQLMESVTDQLKIRNELARIESRRQRTPELEERRAKLIDSLRLSANQSALLQKSMSNLALRKGGRGPNTSLTQLLSDCCQISERILHHSSLQRQPSMLRNKSTLSLRSGSPNFFDDLSVEKKVKRLHADLVKIERSRFSGSTSRGRSLSSERRLSVPTYTPPLPPTISFNPPLLPVAAPARQPLKAKNDMQIRLGVHPFLTPPVTGLSDRQLSGRIYFN